MSKDNGTLPQAHFGEVRAPLPDWRKDKTKRHSERDDDEELAESPPDVVTMLGFDPLDLEDEETAPTS